MAGTLTHKQGGMLFRLTLRKFWGPPSEGGPADPPGPPDIREASDIIGACLTALRDRTREHLDAALALIRRYFPDFQEDDLRPRFGGRHASRTDGEEHRERETRPTPAPNPPEPEPQAEPTPAEPQQDPPEDPPAEPEKPKRIRKPKHAGGNGNGHPTALQERIKAFLAAGITQMLVAGPTGCGKTTCAQLAAAELDREAVLIPCSFGTPAYTFTGRRHPITGEYEDTEFTAAYAAGKLIILDEMDSLDPAVACALNAALANGHIATPKGTTPRSPDTVIVATANTWLTGGDRLYCGRNQLDEATTDRFSGGMIAADYDPDYEREHVDSAVLDYGRRVREHIGARHLRRTCSTRKMLNISRLVGAGVSEDIWRGQFTEGWAASEREGIA